MQSPEKPSKEIIEMWHKDPNNWKLGLFYFNNNDNRIFVSKRISMLGMTFNFAKPITWIIMATLILLIVLFLNK